MSNSETSVVDLSEIPEKTHLAFEDLLNHLLPLALEQLAEREKFVPFGGCLYEGGDCQVVIKKIGDGLPTPGEVIEQLLEMLRDATGKERNIVATCIVKDVKADPPDQEETESVDAVALEMEDRSGWAATTYLPYAFGADGQMAQDEMWARTGEARVFEAPGAVR